ncbi:hypothetical protein [uncultured Polaribacter sp.]|uniref:hypothetical protein n=1 Tax=uncultured Polaribacter sp. TaxID=174711 RepID=UPI00262A2699|nr:hypothetical protein [uncultured Polaribacter sp.]
MKNTYLIILMLTVFISCGKSAKEIEKEKQEAATKIHYQKVNEGKVKKIAALNAALTTIPTALIEVNKKIATIKKENTSKPSKAGNQKLNEGYNKKGELLSYQKSLKNEITSLENLETFDFQKKPEDVIAYILESCKKNDLSNFRYLCDPYSENTANTNPFCLIETLSVKKQQQFRINFLQGNFIGEPVVEGNKATVTFSSNLSSNTIEKVTLINRNGLWYVLSF